MKKLFLSIIIGFMGFTVSMTSVSISAQDVDTLTEIIEENHYGIELQNMKEVFDSHYVIECGSKESRQQFKTNNDLKEIYDVKCKVENDDKGLELINEGLYINQNIHLVESFMDYDLENDSFYLDAKTKLENNLLNSEDNEILELVLFYFESGFEVNTLIVDKAVQIVYDNGNQIVLRSLTYSSWMEYDRDYYYAKQWISSSLYNVDKVYERRVVYDFTDWVAVAVTTCLTFKPAENDYTMYVKMSSCGFLNLGGMYTKYTRQNYNYLEYRDFYEVDDKIGVLPSIKDSGREKFHLTKKLYYDYLMVPYKSDFNGAEVDVYLNYTRYDSEQDNYLTSKSPGAYSGTSTQTVKVRGKIIGNVSSGSRYLYKTQNFEFRDGRVSSCTYSSCFTSNYLDGLEDMYYDLFSFTSAEEVFHTLITNFLFYGSSLGDLYVPTNDYPYSLYGGYVEYSGTWINYLYTLNNFAQRRLQAGPIEIYEHYFRNRLQKGHFPDDLDYFVTLNDSIIPSQRWDVYDIEGAIYHMNDFDRSQGGIISESEKGAYNIKIGSYNGYFELVYSTYYGTALTEEVDWVNMGTYNYNKSSSILHFDLDMTPFKKDGNCGRDEAEGMFSLITDGWNTLFQNHPNYIAYQNNQNAINKYNYYKNLID